jgi:hypothetical protein
MRYQWLDFFNRFAAYIFKYKPETIKKR